MNRWALVPYTRGNGVQVGFDERIFPHFVGSSLERLKLLASGEWDFVVAKEDTPELWRLLKHGGHLCIAGDSLIVYKKTNKKEIVNEPKPAKSCAVVRYGAFGDLIQTSSILPWLKEQGYHVTLYCSTKGYPVIKHDPHVDRFVLQDTDQVPNHELGEWWDYLKTQYDRFINLSESVEGTFLAIPGRANHAWPHEARHRLMNANYLEFMHEVAQVPFPLRQKFYATEREKAWARKERSRMSGPVIVWTLSGSSIHKTWPYLDQIIGRLMLTTSATVVLVGDELCKLLERGWENEKRVLKRSVVWSIRETLSFLPECDLIVGPETGVMNAAGFLSVPKVVTLSHSSPENLTKHWTNCISLTPLNTSCWPCHQLHYSSEFCPRTEKTGTALCQENISPELMWSSIKEILNHAQLRVG